jgi:hypothetical protein
VTDHSETVEALSTIDLARSSVEVLVDGRNCLDAEAILRQGVLYSGIGRRS